MEDNNAFHFESAALQKLEDEIKAGTPIARFLGIKFAPPDPTIEDISITASVTNYDECLNPHGAVFAGTIFSLMTLTGWALAVLMGGETPMSPSTTDSCTSAAAAADVSPHSRLHGGIVLAKADITFHAEVRGRDFKTVAIWNGGFLGSRRSATVPVELRSSDDSTVYASLNAVYVKKL